MNTPKAAPVAVEAAKRFGGQLVAHTTSGVYKPASEATANAILIPLSGMSALYDALRAELTSQQEVAAPVSDADILAINTGDKYFSTSESIYGRETNPHTQYHTGEPGLLEFAREVIALAASRDQVNLAACGGGGATVPTPEFWQVLGELEDECDRAIRKGYAWHGLDELIERFNSVQRTALPAAPKAQEVNK